MKKSLLNALKYNVTSWRWVPFCKKKLNENRQFQQEPSNEEREKKGEYLKRENCNVRDAKRAAYGMKFYQRIMTIKINKTQFKKNALCT